MSATGILDHFLRSTTPGRVLALLLRLTLGGLFLWSGADKLRDLAAFREAVEDYQLLPSALASSWAFVLPFLELALSALLVVGLFTRVSAALVALLLVVFMVAIGINMYRGVEIECGCAGLAAASHLIGWDSLLQDFLMLVAALALSVARDGFLSLDSWWRRRAQ